MVPENGYSALAGKGLETVKLQSLSKVSTQVSYSPVRPEAETLVRSLLAHKGNKEATALGGDTKLSLYGTSPVEVSRDTVTVNLSASALQLDRE